MTMPNDWANVAMWWGPGAALLILLGYGGLRLARVWIEKSLDVRRQQMESMLGMARHYVEQFLGAQKSQAEALSRLASSVEARDTRESFEHQEILIALRALHREVGDLSAKGKA